MTNLGCKVVQSFERVEQAVLEEYKKFDSAIISDAGDHLITSSTDMVRLSKQGLTFAGSALTVRVPPGDNLMVQKAVQLAKEGDVIVIEETSPSDTALIGDIVCQAAKQKGVTGFIVYGAIRDHSALLEMTLPIYAKGVVPRGATKEGPGEINVPIPIGQAAIDPGDLIIGDDDGFVVVPAGESSTVLYKAKEKARQDREKIQKIHDGHFDLSWVDDRLKEKGCEYHS
ncbi:RraA family protein [Alkalihalobacillus oceani]|uniref:RraA family protein n=1 Tax=Halalkalibacter oceani TaxID=1653776 RepID=UPI00203F6A14|nr:RraA family protein [Halalkalibacter oceani]MCM3762104.1 RraA family protein [Halalkalibacter oceani]